MFSASRALDHRSRSSSQTSARLKAPRSSSVDCRSRGSYVPAKKRPSSEERKSSSCLPRWSNPRKSSINLAEGKKISKDSRPLSDKNYQKAQIQEMFQFLEQIGFKSSVTEASLLSPNKKDFEILFKLLYNIVDPEFVVKKLEDDALKMLKTLNYPFPINKSAFTYVARTNWPSLLGILFWLLDICKFFANFDMDLILQSGDCERPEENAILIPFICSCYYSGDVNEEDENALFMKIVRSRMPESLEKMEKIYEDKKIMLERKEEELMKVQELIKENKDLDLNIVRYEEYFEKMEKHMQYKINVCKKLKEEKKLKESELEKLKDEISLKHEIYDAQGFDGKKQMQHYSAQRKELLDSLDQKSSVFNDLQNSYWELEIQYSQTVEKLISACNAFNELYASIDEQVKSSFDLIKKSKQVKLKKLYDNLHFELPDFKLSYKHQDMISQTDVCKEVLKTLQMSINSTGNVLQALTANQKQYLSDLTVKKSELSLQLKILDNQKDQLEKELNSKQKLELQEISKIEQQYEERMKVLEKLKADKLKLENLVNEMKLEFPRIEEFLLLKEKELGECMKMQNLAVAQCQKEHELCLKLAKEKRDEVYKKLQKLKDLQIKDTKLSK